MENDNFHIRNHDENLNAIRMRKIEERLKVLQDDSLLKLDPDYDDCIIGKTFGGGVVYDFSELVFFFAEIHSIWKYEFEEYSESVEYCENQVLRMLEEIRLNAKEGEKIPTYVILDHFEL